MINDKKSVEKSIFYLFLILFFGWIITEFILINQNYLTIKNNEITGLALQIDPIKGLRDIFGYTISIGSDGYPVWAILIAFAIVFSVIFNATRLISLFRGEEHRAGAVIFSIAVSLITIFTTPVISWILVIAAYAGTFGAIIILLLLIVILYIYAHRTVSDNYARLTQSATKRQNARNAFITERNQQPQQQAQQRPGFFRRVFGGNPQQQALQNQPHAQQQNQVLVAEWHRIIKNSVTVLNQLLGNNGRNLNDKGIWTNFIQHLNLIADDLPNQMPNIRLLNLTQIRADANTHAQRCTTNPRGPQQNVHRQNGSTFLRREALQCLNGIEAQLP